MSFSLWYRRWTMLLSLLVLLPGGVLPLGGIVPVRFTALFMAASGGLFLSFLFIRAYRDGPDRTGRLAPHLLTALRGVAAVILLIAAGSVKAVVSTQWESLWSVQTLWTVAVLLALVETTDFMDGRLARKMGHTEFGALWDMETDACFTYSLSFCLWAIRGAVPVVLLIGWMRYLYFLLFRVEGDPPVHPRSYKLFARTVAASLVMVLVFGYVPIVPLSVVNLLVVTVLILQTVSFGWDLLLQVRFRRVSRVRDPGV